MKRNVFVGTLVAAAFAVSVAAQTGSQAGAQDPQSSKSQNQQVTVTGCLDEADMAGGAAGATGTSGQATGTSKTEAHFMLKNAKITSRGAAGTAGTSGTEPSAAASSANDRFLLIGGNQQELKKYLNSEVEIRGTLQPRSGADKPAASAQRSTQGEMNANVQRLRVTSVKQTSPTCSPGA